MHDILSFLLSPSFFAPRQPPLTPTPSMGAYVDTSNILHCVTAHPLCWPAELAPIYVCECACEWKVHDVCAPCV